MLVIGCHEAMKIDNPCPCDHDDYYHHHLSSSTVQQNDVLDLVIITTIIKVKTNHQPLDDHCSLIVNIQGSCYNWRIGLPLNAWGEAFPVGVQCLVRSSIIIIFYHNFRQGLIKSSFISHETRQSRTSTTRGFLLG